jgi:hypothetical protein
MSIDQAVDEKLLDAANGINPKKGRGSELLSAGVYPAAVTGVFPEVSAAGQKMLTLELSPCMEAGNVETAQPEAAMYLRVMLPALEDENKWIEATASKLEKDESFASKFKNADVVTAATKHWKDKKTALYNYNKNPIVKTLRTILGTETIGTLPGKFVDDGENRGFVDEKGKPVPHAVIAEAKKELTRKALTTAEAIYNGEAEIVGKSLFMAVVEGTYNGKTSNQIHYISHKPGSDE